MSGLWNPAPLFIITSPWGWSSVYVVCVYVCWSLCACISLVCQTSCVPHYTAVSRAIMATLPLTTDRLFAKNSWLVPPCGPAHSGHPEFLKSRKYITGIVISGGVQISHSLISHLENYSNRLDEFMTRWDNFLMKWEYFPITSYL